ncbi:MAG: PepSY-like domain-containing protein [Chitinophagales bacterium]|nr:PepSY-like domain-containing protein [Chitinophagaceae bacterium]MCB9066104.1 PepSY-like domain-containing protein [Chitinophagales bacterium]
MKYLLVIAVGVLFASCNNASEQSSNEPAKEKSVQDNLMEIFSKEHPSATDVEWEVEKGRYEVGFQENGLRHSMDYDLTGEFIEEEVEMSYDDLPDAVKEYVKDKGDVNEVCKITSADGKVAYEVDIEGEDLLFDSKGTYTGSQKDDDTDAADNDGESDA